VEDAFDELKVAKPTSAIVMRRRLQHAGVSVAIDAVLKCDVGADATKFRKHMAYVDDAFTAFHNYTKIDLDFPPPRNLLDMARCMVAGSTKLRELGAELLERPVFVQHALRFRRQTPIPGDPTTRRANTGVPSCTPCSPTAPDTASRKQSGTNRWRKKWVCKSFDAELLEQDAVFHL